jgi:hypothetical protein
MKKKIKIKKIPEGPRRSDLGATFRPGRVRSKPTGTRIRKSGGAIKRKTGGTIKRKTGGRTKR